MSFEDFEDIENEGVLSGLEDLAGLEDIEAVKKKKAKARAKKKVVLTTKERIARMRGKQIAKTERTRRAKGECGTYDIGCKIEKGIGTVGKYLLILGAVLGVAWIGKSYLEKRAMQRVVEYPAQRIAVPTLAIQTIPQQ